MVTALQNETNRAGKDQLILIAMLLAMVTVCGLLLYHNSRPVHAIPAETAPAVTQTTAAAAVTTAAVTSVPQATTTAAETEPSDCSLYLQFLSEPLIPAYGMADDSAVCTCEEQTGVAGAYLADLRGTGRDDLLVIRMETLDAAHAAAPVFEWYAAEGGTVTLLDSFSCKMPWSEIAVRYGSNALYVSACEIPLDENAENRKYSELTISMQDADFQTTSLEQDYGNANRPAAQYPADAVLLLTVEPDRTQTPGTPDARRYLLTDYTGIRRLLPEKISADT